MADNLARNSMRKAEEQSSVYVVYPAALLDGWEVVKEHDDKPVFFDTRAEAAIYAKSRAVMDGGAVVKLENWYGDPVSVWEVQPQSAARARYVDPEPVPNSREVRYISEERGHGHVFGAKTMP